MEAVNQIVTCLERTWDGLKVTVKLHPGIEEYFKSRSEGATTDVSLVGRSWRSKKDVPLLVHNIPNELATYFAVSNPRPDAQYVSYRLDQPGQRLVVGDGNFNLSFIRLVGASEGDGVSFTIPGVYSEDIIVQHSRAIEQVAEAFFKQFLKPVKITSIISTLIQEGGSGGYKEVRQGD